MIDRNIRNTRSKEEAKKAHWRAAGTIACMLVIYGIITGVQNFVLKLLKPVGSGIAVLACMIVGFALTSFAAYAVYRYAKTSRKTE